MSAFPDVETWDAACERWGAWSNQVFFQLVRNGRRWDVRVDSWTDGGELQPLWFRSYQRRDVAEKVISASVVEAESLGFSVFLGGAAALFDEEQV